MAHRGKKVAVLTVDPAKRLADSLGLPELAVIMVVAVVVFGPDRLPEFARQAGRWEGAAWACRLGRIEPVRAALYEDPALVRRFPYLPTLRESVFTAAPRPKSPHYDQVSLVVQAVVHDAMTGRQTPEDAVRRLAGELAAVSSR